MVAQTILVDETSIQKTQLQIFIPATIKTIIFLKNCTIETKINCKHREYSQEDHNNTI